MYISPSRLFLLVWLVPLLAPLFVHVDIIQPISARTQALVIANIITFVMLGLFFRKMYRASRIPLRNRLAESIDFPKLECLTFSMFRLWAIIYVITIVYSRGIPLVWVLTGDGRTYTDFGVPTLSGFANMLRAFILASCYLLYAFKQVKRKKQVIGMAIFLLISAFVLETGRGNGVVLLLHPVAFFILLNRISFRIAVKGIFLSIVLLFILGYVQAFRYGGDISLLIDYAESSGFSNVGPLGAILLPSLIYVAVPIVNLDLNIVVSPLLTFEPYYSIQGIVPTVLREMIFPQTKDYGLLVNEANNVLSFYIPFVRDFGVLGAFLCVLFIQVVVCYVYVRARQGKIFHALVWPPLFMSVALSFFSLYFTSLVVLLYPFLAWFVARKVTKKQQEQADTLPAPVAAAVQ